MKSKAFLALVLIFFGGCAAALAVSPLQHIPFEKQTDLPAGTYIMRFSLWNVSSEGAATANMVWSETRTMTFSKANPKVSTRLGAYGSPLE
jgi:hypothetical protein